MVRMNHERVLLIGDGDRQVEPALHQALPTAHVQRVPTVFDGIAELAGGDYSAVLVAVEPLERRPEAALRTLREIAGGARLLLFGHPTLEPLSRKMLQFGGDDYIIAPPAAAELAEIFRKPVIRETPPPAVEMPPVDVAARLAAVPLAEIALDALLSHPQDALNAAVRQINSRLAPDVRVRVETGTAAAPGQLPIRGSDQSLRLELPAGNLSESVRPALSHLADLLGKAIQLQDRYNGLQKLAITDDLTGVHNSRYFNHFLARILEKARTLRFPVTLLLFDIDNFKRYNDQFGHGVGDEILKQTAALMRRCCRDHDLVARRGGDEFAVVFWEKEGPRQPRDPAAAANPARVPQTPIQILERFRRMLATQDFQGLGPTGRGVLTISGGMAVYPYDAQDAAGLIDVADRALVFGAKQSGKNSIFLVGDENALPRG